MRSDEMADAMTTAVLHPGQMGAAVAGQLRRAGRTEVIWLPEGRSPATRERAEQAGLRAVDDIGALVAESAVVLSVCPSDAAEEVAEQVAAQGFAGIYVEANPIGPERVRGIAKRLEAGGATVLDGGILGASGAEMRCYLSGPAEEVGLVRGLFDGTGVSAIPLEGEVGTASALKLAFALWQKGARALAAVSYALADRYEVAGRLSAEAGTEAEAETRRTGRSPLSSPEQYVLPAAVRGWRWELEMGEIAEALSAAELPDELPRGVGEVFARWAPLRDRPAGDLGDLGEALALLRTGSRGSADPG
ncbi:NAD(P)-dependent oxidoreductase [Streptomyces daliensis]